MKINAIRVPLMTAIMLLGVMGCSKPGALTNEKIERAIKEAYKGNYTAKVTSIKVTAGADAAEAEVTLTGFSYSSMHGRLKRPDYSGPAKAVLQHSKIGWVLINLSFTSEYGQHSFGASQTIE